MSRSDFWFTTLSGVTASRPDWAEIAHYLEPVRRYLTLRAPRLPEADRDDLAQEVLVAMAERLVAGYDVRRGRFRAFLKGAIDHKLADLYRRRLGPRRESSLDAVGVEPTDEALAMPEADALAIDLEAELLRAIRAFHDRHAQEGELELVYCFGDRLVKGLSEAEIAAAEGWSRDRVKRLLARARGEVLRELVGNLLARDGAATDDGVAAEAAELVRAGLRRPRDRARLLEAAKRPPAATVAEELGDAIAAARAHFVGLQTEAGHELLRGLTCIFDEDERS